jgi:hypothetical protein
MHDWAIFREAGDVANGIDEQGLPRLGHLVRGGLKAKVQEVALAPDGSGARRLAIHPTAEHFQFGSLLMLVRVRAPAGCVRPLPVRGHWEDLDLTLLDRWSEGLWCIDRNGLGKVDGEGRAANRMIA